MTKTRKIEVLRQLMINGEWAQAIALAASFPLLGEHKARIMKAREAYVRPEFQRQIGRDPAALIADGIAALKERYNGRLIQPVRHGPFR